ncbi:MAG: tRNA threonylcarbamoyladenosine dehydratase [Xanthomonadales bacterium]|nr:tRNA threonylcarbamoyladenosine dehydratase [Xanthomonadales bacterium]
METPAATPSVDPRFAGLDRLYGSGSVQCLGQCSVLVVGLGGVGSWVAEALARSAVGRIGLLDGDELCLTNTNRQLPALNGQYGRAKVEAMAERLQAINPEASVEAEQRFLTSGSLEGQFGRDWDVIIDAADSFRVKVEGVAWCRRRKQPLIVVGSAGGRTDPTLVRSRDLSRTEHDALLALVRKKLRAEFGFPRNRDRYFGITAVYSLENVRYPQADGTVCGLRPEPGAAGKLGCDVGLGAAMMVTATFGMVAAQLAVERLLLRASAK